MKKNIIIKTGSAYPDVVQTYGDFEEWIIQSLGVERSTIQIVNAHEHDRLPDAQECQGVVIAGSHAMVTDTLDWSVKSE